MLNNASDLSGSDPSQDVIVIRLKPHRKRLPAAMSALLLTGFGILLMIIVVAVVGLTGSFLYYDVGGRIYPRVSVGEIKIGGMSRSQAELELEKGWDFQSHLILTNGNQSIEVPASQLGISLDVDQTVIESMRTGRENLIFPGISILVSALASESQVKPVVSIDAVVARQGLESLAPQFTLPAKNASFIFNGSDLVAQPPELGYTLNTEATLSALLEDPGELFTDGVLKIIPMPLAPTITDVGGHLQEAKQILDSGPTIHLYDPIANEETIYPIPPDVLGSWFRITSADNSPQLSIDESGVKTYLNNLSNQIGPERSIDSDRFAAPLAKALRQGSNFWVTASHPPTRYLVERGDTLLKIGWNIGIPYWMILESNPGINPDKLSAGEELIIPSKDSLLPLPIVANKRILISLDRQRLTVFQDGKQLNQFVISTGVDRSPTQPGIFQVQTHDPNAYASVWDLYMPDFLGIYEAWPGFMNGIHGLPLLSNGRRMWANSLGKPASYGCIILGLDEARWLYEWAENGVIVEIREQ